VAVAEIYVLTTHPGHFYAFCSEYSLDPTTILFAGHHIHVFSDTAGMPLEDIRTVDDSVAVADQILDCIRRLTDDPFTRLHCSLAGGRKTQSVSLGFALQLYGRPQDTLLHVLVDEAFEGSQDFFYPTPAPRLIQARDGRRLDASTAEVAVAEIPYVRLRDKHSAHGLLPTSGFAPAVERVQQTLNTLPNLPPLIIEPLARKVCIGPTPIPLEPQEIVLYAQLALARKQQASGGDGFLSLKELNSKREEMLQRYERLYGAYSGHVENLRRAWEKRIPPARLRSRISKINGKIRRAVAGKVQIGEYLVTSERRYGGTRYGLCLAAQRIELRDA
jgi:CRISPR-associated protein (TIGR02584 family)